MIAIYDIDTLERKCNIARTKTIEWTRKFYDVGSFTVKLSLNEPFAEHIKPFNIVSHNGNYGIITRIEQTDILEISGWDLKGLCRLRQVIPPFVYAASPTSIQGYDRISGKAETVIKHYIDSQMINPLGAEDAADRKIQNLIIAENKQRGADMVWQAKFTPLSDELYKICSYAGLGYDISFDSKNKRFIFDVTAGTDRTKSQSALPPVIISTKYNTCANPTYVNDYSSAQNTIYAAGSGEDEQQYIEKYQTAAYQAYDGRKVIYPPEMYLRQRYQKRRSRSLKIYWRSARLKLRYQSLNTVRIIFWVIMSQ